MPQESKFIQLVKKQITAEREYAKHLTELRKKVDIAGARLLLLELLLESEKHAAILTEMLEIMKGTQGDVLLWEHDLEQFVGEALVEKEFREHLRKESGVLAQLKEEVRKTKDDALKLLFQNIEEDEKRHHGVIQVLVRNLYKIDR